MVYMSSLSLLVLFYFGEGQAPFFQNEGNTSNEKKEKKIKDMGVNL